MHKGITLSAAVQRIPDGSPPMIGGFMGVASPHRLIGRLVRQRRRNRHVARQVVVRSGRFDRALQMVQAYLAECAVVSGDPHTAELNEVIGNCIGWMSDNHRDHGQASDARVPQEALRYALGYVDEHSYTSASDDWVDGRRSG
jgi:hypothetical protein